MIKDTLINEQIRAEKVRLISPEGKQIGIVSAETANNQAILAKLDLVMIAPNANPPVCKIMDYSKFRYEQKKQEKEQKRKQKTIQVKELRLSVSIEEHDLQTKARHAIKFLKAGDRVKVTLKYKGRQLGRKELGYQSMDAFNELIKDVGTLESPAKLEGRSLVAYYAPKKE